MFVMNLMDSPQFMICLLIFVVLFLLYMLGVFEIKSGNILIFIAIMLRNEFFHPEIQKCLTAFHFTSLKFTFKEGGFDLDALDLWHNVSILYAFPRFVSNVTALDSSFAKSIAWIGFISMFRYGAFFLFFIFIFSLV